MTFDLLIRGATVVDGSGSPRTRTDVGIRGATVDAIGDLRAARAAEEIDGQALVLAPGFIDAHSHVDAELLERPNIDAAISQGVTTEVLGQDGLSYAPLPPSRLAEQFEYLQTLCGLPGVTRDWGSVAEFLRHFNGRVAQNIAFLAPYGALRLGAAGWTAAPLSPAQLRDVLASLSRALEEGAVGLAVGLDYFPQSAATRAELVALARVVAEHDAVFVAHTRNQRLGIVAAVAEFLGVCAAAGARAHVSHLRDARALPEIDRARGRGMPVTFDVYPYDMGSSMLTMYLPDRMLEGGPAETRRRLADRSLRREMEPDLERRLAPKLSELVLCNVGNSAYEPLVGSSLRQVVESLGGSLGDGVAQLLLENNLVVGFVGHRVSEESLDACVAHPASVGCSDGILVGQRPHPRAWGAFARLVARYVVDRGALSLEECIRKLTSATADVFRIENRGRVQSSRPADLVLFDLQEVRDEATFQEPRRPATGFVRVLVNGQTVWCGGTYSGRAAGAVLRSGGARE